MSTADLEMLADRTPRISASRRIAPIVVLAVLGLALWSWAGGLWDIHNEAEARWILSIREDIAEHEWDSHGRWPLPTLLFHVLVWLNSGIASAWALRLPSVVFGIVSAALCYRIGAFLSGRAAVGWFAGLIFTATAGLSGSIPAIEPGMMFTACVALAIDAWLQRNPFGIGWRRATLILAAAAVSVLTAGWAGPAIIAAVLLTQWRFRRPAATLFVWMAAAIAAVQIDSSLWESILPAVLPAAAIALGFSIEWLAGKTLPRRAVRQFAVGVIIAEVLLLAIGVWMFQDPDFFWKRGFFIVVFGLFWLCCLMILLLLTSLALWFRPTMPVLIGGALILLFALNPVVLGGLRPALNPLRSGANVSSMLDSFMPKHGGWVGAVKKADDPRLHVHGRYRIEEVPDNARKIRSMKKPPAVLVGRRSDMSELMPDLRAHGYAVVKSVLSLDRTFVVARRGKLPKPPDAEALRFVALGDTGTGNSHQRNIGRRMAEQHDRHGPLAACLLLGDVLYGDDNNKTALKKRFLDPFAPLIERRVPFYAALGNHDHNPASKARFMMKSNWFNMGGRNYYARTFGRDLITVFFIDCETIKSDPAQYLWLENELRNCRSDWKVLVNHIPMVASDVLHGDSPATFDLLDHLMIDGGIDLVLSGHNHIYERRHLLDGIQYLTVGCGGHVSDNFTMPRDHQRSIGYNGACAFAWMEVSEDAIRIRAINEFGRRIDEFVLSHDDDGRLVVRDVPRPYDWRRDLPTIARAQVLAFKSLRPIFARVDLSIVHR